MTSSVKETNTIIIGASIAGLASAACLKKAGIDHLIIEKENVIASSWRTHYDRLHLHTNKSLSNLPFKKFDASIPKYPSKKQVIDYLESYQRELGISPLFNTPAEKIYRNANTWIIETPKQVFHAAHVIMATGPFGKARTVDFPGHKNFGGPILHSASYTSGDVFKDKRVLVVGFGNSACEIAMDLHEQGAKASMSVRSAVNVLPRDIAGIPILQLGLLNAPLPPRVADTLNAPLIRALVGNIEKWGLRKLPYGPLEQISKDQKIPLLDFGTMQLIKEGHIRILPGIKTMHHDSVTFENGIDEPFDAVIAAIGYDRAGLDILSLSEDRKLDLNNKITKQKYFGKDGLYFCGFWISPTGQIREIGLDAKKIANDIAHSN